MLAIITFMGSRHHLSARARAPVPACDVLALDAMKGARACTNRGRERGDSGLARSPSITGLPSALLKDALLYVFPLTCVKKPPAMAVPRAPSSHGGGEPTVIDRSVCCRPSLTPAPGPSLCARGRGTPAGETRRRDRARASRLSFAVVQGAGAGEPDSGTPSVRKRGTNAGAVPWRRTAPATAARVRGVQTNLTPSPSSPTPLRTWALPCLIRMSSALRRSGVGMR